MIGIKQYVVILLLFPSLLFVAQDNWDGPTPHVATDYAHIFDNFRQYDIILEPEQNAQDWWAGAPSVVRDDQGRFWMACRMRTAIRKGWDWARSRYASRCRVNA